MGSRPRNQRPASFGIEIKRLGEFIRQLRENRGLTLDAAAEKTTVDWKHLQKIEAGLLNPTVLTLVRIADGFGVPLWMIFRGPI